MPISKFMCEVIAAVNTAIFSNEVLFVYEALRVSSRVELLKCTDVSRNTVSPIVRVRGGDWRPGIPRNVGAFYNIDTAAYPKSFVELKPPWKYQHIQVLFLFSYRAGRAKNSSHLGTSLKPDIGLLTEPAAFVAPQIKPAAETTLRRQPT